MRTSRSLRKLLALGLGIALGVAGGLLLWDAMRGGAPVAADWDPYQGLPPEIVQRIGMIETELVENQAIPTWAGVYGHSDGFQGAELHVAPEAGFVFIEHGCLGLYGSKLGAILTEGARVRLLPAAGQQAEPDGLDSLQTELIPARWGGTDYLIVPEQMIAFVNDARAGLGHDSQYGPFWKKHGRVDSPATGLPEIPEEFAEAMDAGPIRGTLVELLSVPDAGIAGGALEVLVRLNISSGQGSYPMMHLIHKDSSSGAFTLATVTTTDSNDCTAQIFVGPDNSLPEVGWMFTRVPFRSY